MSGWEYAKYNVRLTIHEIAERCDKYEIELVIEDGIVTEVIK